MENVRPTVSVGLGFGSTERPCWLATTIAFTGNFVRDGMAANFNVLPSISAEPVARDFPLLK